MWKSSQWLAKNTTRGTCKRLTRKKRCTGRQDTPVEMLKTASNTIQSNLRILSIQCHYVCVCVGGFNGKHINPSPDDKILGLPKLKAFAGDKSIVTQNI